MSLNQKHPLKETGRIPMLERDQVAPEIGELYDRLFVERAASSRIYSRR
jgi:hypothetical protein